MTRSYHFGTRTRLLSAGVRRVTAFSILATILIIGTASNILVQNAYAANTLTVNGVSLDGRTLNMWVTLSSGGATVKTGFTTVVYTGSAGATFSVTVSDYGS